MTTWTARGTQIKSGETVIASTNTLTRSKKDNEAHARMIAALPELLEVAEALVKWDFRNRREHFKQLAQDAVNKARGQ
jgi:hypothetical protein